ncbi:hypothetical protein GCM10009641_85040 [Mycobacterium cookii]|uniref:Uncharacterized protein n=2 Tax=Nocardioides furvisabuli TaxID=375542 RepID=A0ABP5J089_9ACTN
MQDEELGGIAPDEGVSSRLGDADDSGLVVHGRRGATADGDGSRCARSALARCVTSEATTSRLGDETVRAA